MNHFLLYLNTSIFLSVIFGVYANEAGTHVIRSDMLRQLQQTEGGYAPEVLHKCFGQVSLAYYDICSHFLC